MKLINQSTGKIFKFDPKLARIRRMQKRVKAWSDRIGPYLEQLGKGYRLVMIRLSYAGVDDWRPGHISDFVKQGRKMFGDRLLAYAWVGELQKRGAVHYHVLFLVKAGTKIPVPDKSGWWVHGSTRIETGKTPYYILTYTGKKYQKFGDFPKGMHMFAVWIADGVISEGSRWLFRLSTIPKWLAEAIYKDKKFFGLHFPVRVPGGGWECGGDRYYSPYSVWDFDEI